ncbi:hypothetical protein Tco_0608309 [Tanacetum coccineum]
MLSPHRFKQHPIAPLLWNKHQQKPQHRLVVFAAVVPWLSWSTAGERGDNGASEGSVWWDRKIGRLEGFIGVDGKARRKLFRPAEVVIAVGGVACKGREM